MRIESPYFGDYDRLARVLEHTARHHCPNWAVNVYRIDPTPLKAHRRAQNSHIANTQKMESWNDVIQAAPDGDRILLIDADTFFTNPIDDIWDRGFDLAYTNKDSRFPFNSGVIFVRVSPRTKRFFADWAEVNRNMLIDADRHLPWRAKFGGINQAAFGQMLETNHGLDMLTLPCQEWNCEDSAWADFDPATTRIVHVKSALRAAVFGNYKRRPGVARLADLWKELEDERGP